MDIEGMPEAERLAKLAELDSQRPGLSTLAAGVLAGRATPDRPDVAIWEYEEYAAAHGEITLDELIAVRFPVIFFGGENFTIESAAEELRTDPFPPSFPVTLESVIDRWRRLHDAGVVRWSSEKRAVEMVLPQDDYNRVTREWGAAQRAARP